MERYASGSREEEVRWWHEGEAENDGSVESRDVLFDDINPGFFVCRRESFQGCSSRVP